MNTTEIVIKMMERAKETKDDTEANELANISNRLSHQGALFEPSLTEKEISVIEKFMKGLNK